MLNPTIDLNVGAGLARDDMRRLRDAFGRFATGVTVVTTRGRDGKLEGVTANSFSSISLDPPLVQWSLNGQARSRSTFETAEWFAVNILSLEQIDLSHNFAWPRADKFEGVDHRPGLGGCPLLEGSLAHFECRRDQIVSAGDHIILIGQVRRTTYREGLPLVFSGGEYCQAMPFGGGSRK